MKRFALCVLTLGLLIGCASHQANIRVESIADESAAQQLRRFVVFPGNSDTDAGSLEFRNYATQIGREMTQRGYMQVVSPTDAEIAVFLQYQTTGPHTSTSTSVMPLWGQTGYSSSQTFGTFDQFGGYSGSTTYTPTYGVTGYMPVTNTSIYYVHGLRLSAYDVRQLFAGKRQEVWNATATGISSDANLRDDFWILVEAIGPSIGRTQPATTIAIKPKKN
ncbi:DUF4136 domain-containing protein [Achromobacter deleyi]|uniref:DUF4136 domain-containing protein n=1 Tax=Achromobacter deleyi TaxID=1353891 RepID=UPI001469584E|nr:hypothetical protein [Achromobacter deleyi]CAB3928779.1 hypothetical protein LMG3412_06378 [Achromobacter deleyi]